MKILVTGGAGFIGSAFVRSSLINTKDEIVNIDKLTYAGNLSSLAEQKNNARHTFERVDICNRQNLDTIFAKHKPDKVIHLAAESHVDRSIDSPSDFIQTNIIGTYNMLEASRVYFETMEETRKVEFVFHHVSTDEVYGDLEGDETLFTETTHYAPSSPYSASKASSDHLVRSWHRTFGLPVVLTNCSNNYGPYHFPEKLIPHMILNALSSKPLPIYGDGQQIRDWLFVDDHARALREVLTKGKVGQTYNIGGHCERKNIQVVEFICEELQKLKPRNSGNYKDLITFVKDRPGHDKRYAIDASKIERELGWRPLETFESGMKKTIKWYLENEDWWRAVLDGSYRLERMGNKV